jgi:murein DD-endopeptidase MepM/ murein hydrolase activator NlpD
MIFPILAPCRWHDDYGAPREGFLHTAIDIAAAKMSPIVAPIDGTLGFKTETFWIYGDDGWAVLGTHLNDDSIGTHDRKGDMDVMFAPDLVPGQHVYAGQFLGYVGMSGNATGPHLHFELYAPGKGDAAPRLRNPKLSLVYAKKIAAPRIHLSGPGPDAGQMRIDGCIRKLGPAQGTVTLIVTSKMIGGHHAAAVFGPRYLRLKVSPSVVAAVGGWPAIQALNYATPIACYLPWTPKLDDASVSRLGLPRVTL